MEALKPVSRPQRPYRTRNTKRAGTATIVLVFLCLPTLLACLCTTTVLTVSGNQRVEAGTTDLTIEMTRFDEISPDHAIMLRVHDAPFGSELRFELSPGMELVGTGPDLALELDNLNELLMDCEEGCDFPVRLTIVEAEPGATYEFEMSQIGGHECGDQEMEAWLR